MPNIGFTHKTEEVYNRFQKMRQAYQDANGRTYAPDFLVVLMDGWEKSNDPKPKTGWAGTDPDEFLRGHGFRADFEQENEQ